MTVGDESVPVSFDLTLSGPCADAELAIENDPFATGEAFQYVLTEQPTRVDFNLASMVSSDTDVNCGNPKLLFFGRDENGAEIPLDDILTYSIATPAE